MVIKLVDLISFPFHLHQPTKYITSFSISVSPPNPIWNYLVRIGSFFFAFFFVFNPHPPPHTSLLILSFHFVKLEYKQFSEFLSHVSPRTLHRNLNPPTIIKSTKWSPSPSPTIWSVSASSPKHLIMKFFQFLLFSADFLGKNLRIILWWVSEFGFKLHIGCSWKFHL